jgi:hypothetical protein
VDYQIALQIANIVFENNIEDGFAISYVEKISNPLFLSNLSLFFVMIFCFGWGLLEGTKYAKITRVIPDDKELLRNSREWILIRWLLVILVNMFPIGFIQGSYSMGSRHNYIAAILYFSFLFACIALYFIGRYVNRKIWKNLPQKYLKS